jgi:hypothetical protein
VVARIALYGHGGSPYNHAALLARAGHRISFVFAPDIKAGLLESFDAFVMPGGAYLAMQGQLEPLGADGCRAIREYVERGGMYIGSCAGSYDAATVPARFLELCPVQQELCLLEARVWNVGDSRFGVIESPGVGEILAENAAPDHPVMAGMPAEFRITHYNGPLFEGGQALARVKGGTENFTPGENFLGADEQGLLIDRAAEAGVANIVVGQRGAGRVVLFGSHPEFGSSLSLDDVSGSARMLTNAVDWQLEESGHVERPEAVVFAESNVSPAQVEADLERLPALIEQLSQRCERLSTRTADAPWLDNRYSMSMLGRPPREIWAAALHRIPELAAEAQAHAAGVRADLLSFRSPAEWNVDGGFYGLVPLLEQAAGQLAQAETTWVDSWPGTVSDAYDYMRESPYHLVAGSYLAAVGRVASAALLARTAAPVTAG